MSAPSWFARALDDGAVRLEPAAAWTATLAGVGLLAMTGAMVGGPVLSLLQDSDPPLARDIVTSREAIWSLLADPAKFATLS